MPSAYELVKRMVVLCEESKDRAEAERRFSAEFPDVSLEVLMNLGSYRKLGEEHVREKV